MRSNFKYIERKGRDLDFVDLSRKEFPLSNVINFIDKLLFKNPATSLSFLILFVALPITMYLTLREESTSLLTHAKYGSLKLSGGDISDLTSSKEYIQKYEVESKDLYNLTVLEVKSPSWLVKGEEIGGESSDKSFRYKMLIYSGIPGSNTQDGFAVLFRGLTSSDISDCQGCDQDQKYEYVLDEFNLNTKSCEKGYVWGRNPVGISVVGNVYSFCQRFDNSCLISSSWKAYNSDNDCKNDQDPPEFKKLSNDKIYTFNTSCDGNFQQASQDIALELSANDKNGDIVRFSVSSIKDLMSVDQQSVEEIVRQVSGSLSARYEEFEYAATLSGKLTSDFVGSSYPVTVYACDVLGKCSNRTFQISAITRSGCDFMLPSTGNIDLEITFPTLGSEVKGMNTVVWEMSGAGSFDVAVKLYRTSCGRSQNFIADIAKFEKLSLGESKGYTVGWDTRRYEDGTYCMLILTRDAELDPTGSNWNPSDSVTFSIRNANQNPTITSSPSKTNLVTGESFEYQIQASDPDGDSINYDVIGLPSWLAFSNRTVAGSTAVPGTYHFVVFVDDNHGGYATQNITINVNPPENHPSEISFIFPVKNSVLKGAANKIKWSASDQEGISRIQLYYSQDGKVWILIGTYSANTSETNWDVSSLKNGQYYLRLVATDGSEQQVTTGKTSESFYVSNGKEQGSTLSPESPEEEEPSEEEEENGEIAGEETSMPAISNLTPKADSETYSKRPLISASLYASDNEEIVEEETKVFLDDEEITSKCEVSKTDVFCQSKEDSNLGKHKVRIEIVDSGDKEMTEEWYFTILQPGSLQEEAETGDELIILPLINKSVSKSVLIVSGVLCLAAFLLILIPWLIYFIWKKRESGFRPEEIIPAVYPQPQPPTPASPSSGSEFYTPPAYPQDYPSSGSTPHGYPNEPLSSGSQ